MTHVYNKCTLDRLVFHFSKHAVAFPPYICVCAHACMHAHMLTLKMSQSLLEDILHKIMPTKINSSAGTRAIVQRVGICLERANPGSILIWSLGSTSSVP